MTFGVDLSQPGVQGQHFHLRVMVAVETTGSVRVRSGWRTFEDVAFLQFLPVWALGKALLQCLNSFRIQRVLAQWTSAGSLSGIS